MTVCTQKKNGPKSFGAITANMFLGGQWKADGVAMVTSDRVLLGSCRLFILTILLSVGVWSKCKL